MLIPININDQSLCNLNLIKNTIIVLYVFIYFLLPLLFIKYGIDIEKDTMKFWSNKCIA